MHMLTKPKICTPQNRNDPCLAANLSNLGMATMQWLPCLSIDRCDTYDVHISDISDICTNIVVQIHSMMHTCMRTHVCTVRTAPQSLRRTILQQHTYQCEIDNSQFNRNLGFNPKP